MSFFTGVENEKSADEKDLPWGKIMLVVVVILGALFWGISSAHAADKTNGPIFVTSRSPSAIEESERSKTVTTTNFEGQTARTSEVEVVNSKKTPEAVKLEIALAKLQAKVAIAEAKAKQVKVINPCSGWNPPQSCLYGGGGSYYSGNYNSNSYVTPYGATYSGGNASAPVAYTGNAGSGSVRAYGK